MIFFVIELLRTRFGLKVPAVFSYTSTRMILAALTALILCIFLGPLFIRKLYGWKMGSSVRSEDCPMLGQLHEKKKNTPAMGGILILFSMLVSMLLWMDWTHIFTVMLFLTTLVLGALGAYDDWLKLKFKNTRGVSGKKKLLVQVAFSSLVALYLLYPAVSQFLEQGSGWFIPPVVKEQNVAGVVQRTLPIQEYAAKVYLPFFKDSVWTFTGPMLLIAGLLIVFVITGSSNAVNLTDGLDGLAAGCLIMVASCLALIAFVSNNVDVAGYLNILYIEGSGEIAVYLCAFAGACLGFLWYNGHPAQVFMGDTGSLALGGILGVSAVLLKREMLLAIVGGIFVAEAMSVILQVGSYKLRNKKRIFLIAPLHHHFEYKGWPETKVVVRFWIIGLLLAIVGVASIKFQ